MILRCDLVTMNRLRYTSYKTSLQGRQRTILCYGMTMNMHLYIHASWPEFSPVLHWMEAPQLSSSDLYLIIRVLQFSGFRHFQHPDHWKTYYSSYQTTGFLASGSWCWNTSLQLSPTHPPKYQLLWYVEHNVESNPGTNLHYRVGRQSKASSRNWAKGEMDKSERPSLNWQLLAMQVKDLLLRDVMWKSKGLCWHCARLLLGGKERLLWRRRWLPYAIRRLCTIRTLVLRVFLLSPWYRGWDVFQRHTVHFLWNFTFSIWFLVQNRFFERKDVPSA